MQRGLPKLRVALSGGLGHTVRHPPSPDLRSNKKDKKNYKLTLGECFLLSLFKKNKKLKSGSDMRKRDNFVATTPTTPPQCHWHISAEPVIIS